MLENVGFIWNHIIKCTVCISQRGSRGGAGKYRFNMESYYKVYKSSYEALEKSILPSGSSDALSSFLRFFYVRGAVHSTLEGPGSSDPRGARFIRASPPLPISFYVRGPVHPTLEGPGSSDPLLLSPDLSM